MNHIVTTFGIFAGALVSHTLVTVLTDHIDEHYEPSPKMLVLVLGALAAGTASGMATYRLIAD